MPKWGSAILMDPTYMQEVMQSRSYIKVFKKEELKSWKHKTYAKTDEMLVLSLIKKTSVGRFIKTGPGTT